MKGIQTLRRLRVANLGWLDSFVRRGTTIWFLRLLVLGGQTWPAFCTSQDPCSPSLYRSRHASPRGRGGGAPGQYPNHISKLVVTHPSPRTVDQHHECRSGWMHTVQRPPGSSREPTFAFPCWRATAVSSTSIEDHSS